MKGHAVFPLSSLKWGEDGDLSQHDTAALISRLARAEKSRRSLVDHHNLKSGRSYKPRVPTPLPL
ncbi:MAG: hypothetical protein CMN97_07395 [Synechococcus sp. NAT40]|nr:hypothetical protein [Synechococcus sp. NAT40]RZO12407.1 MAG: hypothetical protein EVB08_07995 [Synechococcus sp. MED-G135]